MNNQDRETLSISERSEKRKATQQREMEITTDRQKLLCKLAGFLIAVTAHTVTVITKIVSTPGKCVQ